MRRLLVTALLIAATACATVNPARNDIGRFVDETLREMPGLPALGVAVVQNGRIVYLHDANRGYYIGSTTKAYTGLACAILAQRGLIDLDVPVSRYLPETTVIASLRAFLTHTSALSNDAIVFRTAFSGQHTPDLLLSLLNQSKTIPPGFHYDNLGYVVASLVIERVTHQPWQQALEELVFRPLGMMHTTSYMSVAEKGAMARPYHHTRTGAVEPLAFNKVDETMHGAGGIVTTPADLARWLIANIDRGRIDGRQVIPAAAFDEAQKLQVQTSITRGDFEARGYGFGWYRGLFRGQSALFHLGGYEGWHSEFAMLPDQRVGAGVMTNINGPEDEGADLVVSYAAARLLGSADDCAARLAATKERVRKITSAMVAEVQRRAQRPWSLSRDRAAYAGRYVNPMFGTLTVEQRGDRLFASIGPLTAVLEPFTQPESSRVELVSGSGEVLRFQFGSGDSAEAVSWGDDLFRRVD